MFAFLFALQQDLPPVDAAKSLTLEQAVQVAYRDNPQLKASRYQVEAARANMSGQRAPINPTFTYAGLNNTVTPQPTLNVTDPSNYSLLLTLETNGANQW